MNENIGIGDRATAHVRSNANPSSWARLKGEFRFRVLNEDGSLDREWTEENLIVDEGLDEILDVFVNGSSYSADHYVGLTDGTPTVAAGDTMGSHGGWTEVTDYSEGSRPAYTPGAVSGQSVDNSGTVASFSINASTTVGGAFITTSSTKGGSTGTLVCAVAFGGGDEALSNGQTLEVTYTLSAADDGS